MLDSIRSGSAVRPRLPIPLVTLTTTGAGLSASSGRKAWETRTTPKTLVS